MPFSIRTANGACMTINPANWGLKKMAQQARSRHQTPKVAPQATPNPKAAEELNRRIRGHEQMVASTKGNANAYTRPGSMKG